VAGSFARAGILAALGVIAAHGCTRRPPPLETLVRGGGGPPTLVLLHGYGSSAEQWLPFTASIQWPPPGRFVFPQGPESGPAGGRAWWPLDLASHLATPDGLPDISATAPIGMAAASDRVIDVLDDIHRSIGAPLVLGGFSQGAMVASDIAFRSATPIDALVLLSPTVVAERSWADGYPRRRGLPVFIAHGRRDTVLSFRVAERLRDQLQAAGLEVIWQPFDGDHEIPATVIAALNRFLAGILARLPRKR
jgi:phospholipase/carboxylesterase